MWLRGLPDYQSPEAFQVSQATKIYSADGKLLAKLCMQNREIVPLSEMATGVVDGLVAIEDERFYEHGGYDPLGILRAAFTNANGGDRQGASTITQQYVRNTVLFKERNQMTIQRKVREAYLAEQIEKKFSKRQILENYLNTVYFGEGAYGVESAAHIYFAKPARELTFAEGALIAGLVQAPSALDPYRNPAGAVRRRKDVLDRMLYNNYITQAEYREAITAPLALKREALPELGIYYAPYYVSYVKTMLEQKYGTNTVFNGGLTVYTTLDTRMQRAAEKAAHRDYNSKRDPLVSLVAIDPRDGFVKAMVGGNNYHKRRFNLATQGYRQPGSSFKTFVLVSALKKGMPPDYRIDSNAPVTIPSKVPWEVHNDEGNGNGPIPLTDATWHSVNAAYARIAFYGVGIKSVIRTAHAMGVQTHLPNFPSITLGSVGCTPMEMASAYGTLAAQGVHYDPVVITKVVNRDGATVFEAQPKGKVVVSRNVAYAATHILEGVLTKGTGRGNEIGRPAAGKTGTSSGHRDCWFIGYTPQLVTSVWVGYSREKTVYALDGSKGFGGSVAAPIWARFMKKALKGKPKMKFEKAPAPPYNPGKFDIPGSGGGTSNKMVASASLDSSITARMKRNASKIRIGAATSSSSKKKAKAKAKAKKKHKTRKKKRPSTGAGTGTGSGTGSNSGSTPTTP
jgi:1A family penicillin-binding protein